MFYLGLLAALLTSFSFVPQVYKIWKENDTSSISLHMFIAFTLGVVCWLAYGILRNDAIIIMANGFTLTMSGYILFKKLTEGSRNKKALDFSKAM